jgi:hypothetical protein
MRISEYLGPVVSENDLWNNQPWILSGLLLKYLGENSSKIFANGGIS